MEAFVSKDNRLHLAIDSVDVHRRGLDRAVKNVRSLLVRASER